jgi:hypothetical protein
MKTVTASAGNFGISIKLRVDRIFHRLNLDSVNLKSCLLYLLLPIPSRDDIITIHN